MGGNALKNIEIKRMTKDEFYNTYFKVKNFISDLGLECSYPKFYSSKDSFGDVDIVVKINDSKNINLCIDAINDFFKPLDSYRNGTVYSFEVDMHQVDLIFVSEENYNSSLNYLSYNDLFNLLGRLAHRIGFKLGHKGLSYVVKNGDYTLGDVVVCKHLKDIFSIIDVNYKQYLEGFEAKEDIFKFVTESKYFNKNIFDYQNLNHINRVRNKKRKMYRDFIEYLEDKEFNSTIFNKEELVSIILPDFPQAREKIEKLWTKLKIQKEVHNIFNAYIVKDIKNVEGKELGIWMKHFKSKYSNQFWLDNKDNINNIIKDEKLISF